MNRRNTVNYSVFLNTMIREWATLVADLEIEYDAGASWIVQDRDDISLQALTLTLPDKTLEICVRFTSTPAWFQIDCGPISKRVSYTRQGADTIRYTTAEISVWMRDCFEQPESVDSSSLFKLTPTDGIRLLWPVEGYANNRYPDRDMAEDFHAPTPPLVH